ILAERRDFTVATYSSALGTGSRLTVCVFTGMGCGAGCFASVRLHPEFANIANRTSTDCATTARSFTVSPRLTSMNKMMLAGGRKVQRFLNRPALGGFTGRHNNDRVFGKVTAGGGGFWGG